MDKKFKRIVLGNRPTTNPLPGVGDGTFEEYAIRVPEIISVMNDNLDSLRDYIENLSKRYNAQLDKIYSAGEGINIDENNVISNTYRFDATDILSQIDDLQMQINNLVIPPEYDDADIQEKYANLQTDINGIISDIQVVNSKIEAIEGLQSEFSAHKEDYATEIGTVANLTTTSKVVVGAVNELNTNKANKVQEDWITPTLQNAFEFPEVRRLKYRKTSINQLEFKGALSGGSFNTSAFTLPQGYRPEEIRYVNLANVYVSGEMYCEIRNTGHVVIRTISSGGNFTGIKYFDGVIIPLD